MKRGDLTGGGGDMGCRAEKVGERREVMGGEGENRGKIRRSVEMETGGQ